MLTAVLLLFVAVAGPWVVHLAPRRQRLLALVGFTGILVLWLLFENWFGKWYFWLGLAGGVVSVMVAGQKDDHGSPPAGRRGRSAPSDLTEEF